MWEKVLAELREIVMNQMFLTPQNDKFICFSLIWYRTWGEKEGSSMRRSSYLRSSFLLIRAFIYSESFFCINAKRSQALPLPTGVLQKHRNQLKVAELEATVGQVHLLPLTGPPSIRCTGCAPHSLSHHTPVGALPCGPVGARGVFGTNALVRN